MVVSDLTTLLQSYEAGKSIVKAYDGEGTPVPRWVFDKLLETADKIIKELKERR